MRRVAHIATLVALALVVSAADKHPKGPAPPPEALDPPDASNGYNYEARQKKAIEMVQRTSARIIDSTVADTNFADWFRQVVGPNAKISWELNDCGETGCCPDSGDVPGCVQATADFGEVRAYVLLGVGTLQTGETGPPEFFYAGLDGGERPASIRSLGEFSKYNRVFRQISQKK